MVGVYLKFYDRVNETTPYSSQFVKLSNFLLFCFVSSFQFSDRSPLRPPRILYTLSVANQDYAPEVVKTEEALSKPEIMNLCLRFGPVAFACCKIFGLISCFIFFSRVLHWHPNAGSTVNSQILNEVSQCVESINGVKEGRWKATLTFYKPMIRGHLIIILVDFPWIFYSSSLSGCFCFLISCLELNYPSDQSLAAEFPREFLGMSLPEQPNKYYFIIRAQRLVMEADSSIQMIMEKLQSYKSRVALNFEVWVV